MKILNIFIVFLLGLSVAFSQTRQNNVLNVKKASVDTAAMRRVRVGGTLQNFPASDSELTVEHGAHIKRGLKVDGTFNGTAALLRGNPAGTNLIITDSAVNSNTSTLEQASDTSAFKFSFTGTHKPLLNITGPTGNTVLAVDSGGSIALGVAAPALSTTRLEIVSTTAASVLMLKSYRPNGTGSFYSGTMARGTPDSPAAIQVNDEIASLRAAGYNGSVFTASKATFDFIADTNWDLNANGTAMRMRLTPNSSTSLVEVLRINNKGFLGMGTTTPIYKLDLRNSSSESQMHLSATSYDDGGYLGSTNASHLYISGGSVFDGTNWIAKSSSSAEISLNSGNIGFFSNSSLVSGNSFTPYERIRIDGSSGNVNVMVGKFTQYSNIALEGMGLSAISDTVEKTNQNSGITSTNLNSTSANGLYRINYYLACTTSDASGATVSLNLSWNDGGSKSKISSMVGFSSTSNVADGVFVIRNVSGYISYSSTISGSLIGGKYILSIGVERIY
jgi:hypothetical protein